jgi:hypothetical protein
VAPHPQQLSPKKDRVIVAGQPTLINSHTTPIREYELSGNAPELPCYCESSDYQKAQDMTQMVLNMLKQYNALSLF